MLVGQGLNWWSFGGADPAPPPANFSAMTGMTNMYGDVDYFLIFLAIGLTLCFQQ